MAFGTETSTSGYIFPVLELMAAQLEENVDYDAFFSGGHNQSVEAVSVVPGAPGTAHVEVRPASVGAEASPLSAEGRTVTPKISTSSCSVSFRPRNSRTAPTRHPAPSNRFRFAVFIVYRLMPAP